tara:strand:- start:2053 stop:2208 length:156 start_codon:yes stop_codon:yes gene_type:complete
MHYYTNKTGHTIQLKTSAGNITVVKNNEVATTSHLEPFKKVKYPFTGWRKF